MTFCEQDLPQMIQSAAVSTVRFPPASFGARVAHEHLPEVDMAAPKQALVSSSLKPSRGEWRFRVLVESAPDAIIQVDRNRRIILINRMTEKLFGFTREELLGQAIEILLPDDFPSTQPRGGSAYWHQPLAGISNSAFAIQGRRKDGSGLLAEISLCPVQSREGFSTIAMIRDIGGRGAIEDQLRAMQEKLTNELRLRREMERAGRLRIDFLSDMSHELRTSLDTVIGFSELLAEELKGPLNQDQMRFVQHIHTDSMHLLNLFNEILDLSKIEAGRLQLRSETFEMSAAVEEVLSAVRSKSETKSIRMETRLDASLTLHADCLRFKQILFRLLSNAVKCTPERGKIRIAATHRNSFVEIAVTDTGIGIPRTEHESVFEVGTRPKGVREGTGLGLAITKALVEQHGGRIWIESKPRKGNRFAFTIPAGAAAARVNVG